MIRNRLNTFFADAIVLKVGERWYICSYAKCFAMYDKTYEYKTPTLKFSLDVYVNGCNLAYFDEYAVEIIGNYQCLKLEPL